MKEPQIYRRTRNGFAPASRLAQEFYDKTAGQDFVELVGKKLRNPTYHRRFWPKLNLVVENSDQFKSIDQLRFVIMALVAASGLREYLARQQPSFQIALRSTKWTR